MSSLDHSLMIFCYGINDHFYLENNGGESYKMLAPISGHISSAAHGNFLEVLNMSLNTFENHYLNRNLDRTGQQCLVITPGISSLIRFDS